jgi:hypothetical protein
MDLDEKMGFARRLAGIDDVPQAPHPRLTATYDSGGLNG